MADYSMRFSQILALMFIAFVAQAQKKRVTFYDHIEPIVKKNCQPCHQPGKPGPFNLITYDDVASKAEFIAHVTSIRYMPPWQADNSFQQYLNQRGLSTAEIDLIGEWARTGMTKGKGKKAQPAQVQHGPTRAPDLSITMPKPYAISATGEDDYRFFNMPTNLAEDKYITKIEFIAGNKKLVHHSRIMTDTTHRVRSIDGMSANDPGISQFEKYPPLDKFLYGWVPGNFPIEFPAGTGKRLFKATDLIVNIHYAPNAKPNEQDQSTVNFYFSDKPVDREVFSLAIAEESISNPPFVIKANEKKTFYSSFGPIPVDISAIAVLPHMHYLGKTFRAFAVTPDGSAVPLIKIDNWDFKWQDTYQFKKLLKIPKGSTILMEGTFDNTSSNGANPSNPPRDVTYGWNTTSEMFDIVIYYLMYKPGDETNDIYATGN